MAEAPGSDDRSVGGSSPASCAAAERVAVVVVHGVADQRPGETVATVVQLLTAASPAGVTYTATGGLDLAIGVAPMRPNPRHAFEGDEPARVVPQPAAAVVGPAFARSAVAQPHAAAGDAKPAGAAGADAESAGDSRAESWTAALRQSVKSDFHRSHPGETGGAIRRFVRRQLTPLAARAATAAGKPAAVAAPASPDASIVAPVGRHPGMRADRGLQFTSFLLAMGERHDTPHEEYATRRTRLERRQDGRTTTVDCFEMYWADLSRLSGFVPTIVSELFTFMFRLSNLGRDTVGEAAQYADANRSRPSLRWKALFFFQSLIDWCFTNVLAQLFALLLLVGALVILIGVATPDRSPDAETLQAFAPYLRAAGLASAVVAVAVAFYFRRAGARWLAIGWAFFVVVIGVAMFAVPTSPWAFVVAVVLLLAIAYRGVLEAANERFPAVRDAGSTLGVLLVGWMTWHVVANGPFGVDDWSMALAGALAGFELLLLAIKWWWICAAAALVVWAGFSVSTAWRPYDERASAATGRLGLLGGLAIFVATSMALWAVLEPPIEKAVETLRYDPVIWTTQPAMSIAAMQARASDPRFCYADHLVLPFAGDFLKCRFDESTAMFSSVAVLLVAILGYLVVTVVPSILAELTWTRSTRAGADERLGLWLTSLFRALDGFVLAVTIFAVFAVLVFAFDAWREDVADPLSARFTSWSRGALAYLVFPATTVFAALSAFGRYLSRTLPGLRGPLDAALDVDNYFREFPRTRIPRVRIFSRYRALLRRIRDDRYDRVVIVSHSQGTVISAEFLRFVSSVSTDNRRHDRRARLRELMGCDVRLLTLGCPLRQLYATRFPSYYEWILDPSGHATGPLAADVGVEKWANAFGSGDYVGRWLWSAAATPPDGMHPLSDRLADDGRFGRDSVYQPYDPIPVPENALHDRRDYETCTGFGAHTHYFDLPKTSAETSVVAYLIDGLIADPSIEPEPAA